MREKDLQIPLFTQIQAERLAKKRGHRTLEDYQEFFGLKVDGVAGPITESHMVLPRCGVPEHAGAEEAQWPRSCLDVTCSYRFSNRLNLTAQVIDQAWREAIRKWNATCGIRLSLIRNLDRARIWATSAPLPGSTLAWSYLANDTCNTRLEQRYDSGQNWSYQMFLKTVFHEVGHALGLQHSRNKRDIMYPSITNEPWSIYPGPGDIRETVGRYGEPQDEPDPDPDPDPDNPQEGITVFIPGGKVIT